VRPEHAPSCAVAATATVTRGPSRAWTTPRSPTGHSAQNLARGTPRRRVSSQTAQYNNKFQHTTSFEYFQCREMLCGISEKNIYIRMSLEMFMIITTDSEAHNKFFVLP
jgi:hypothetical protein